MKRNIIKNIVGAVALVALAGCSGSGSCSPGGGNGENTGDLSKLNFAAPNIVPSLPTLIAQGYIVAINNGEQTLNNLVYSVTETIGGGEKITIDQTSAAKCRIIPAHGECIFKVNVPAGTIAGSFVMNGNQDGSLLSRLINRITVKDAAITPSTVIGVEQTPYTVVLGADGIPIYYYSVIIAGTPYVVVSGAVTSSNAGSFNNIVLVDGNNNVLPNQQAISGNLGAGLTNLSQGSTFAILLPAPSGTNVNQVIKIQTQEVSASGEVSNVQTGSINYNLSTTSNEGIVNLFPGAVYLTADNPEQIVTFYNNGDAQAQLQQFLASNANVEVTFSPSVIGGSGKSTATLKLKDTSVSANNGSIMLTYNNSKGETTATGKVDENVYPTPTPSPSPTPTPAPTPTPSPSPTPTPTAGLTATFTPNNFDITTADLTAVRTVTLKNTGNTNETNFVFTFTPSNGFIVTTNTSPSSTPACTVDGSGKVTTVLAPEGECAVTVTYTSPNTSAGSYTATMGLAYTYDNSTSTNTTPQSFNTNVVQSTANLSSTANTTNNFGNVLNNDTAVSSILYFKLQNTGAVDAMNLTFTDSNSLFHITTTGAPGTACTTSGTGTLAAGSNCYYGIQFGPISSSTGSGVQNDTTTINYSWASGGASGTPSTTQTSTGSVQTANSAAIALSGPVASGFANNTGPQPYQIQQNSTGKLTYTYTNTGSQAATNFYVTDTGLPGGWTRSGGTCASAIGTPLNNNSGTCTVEFSITSNSTGSDNFNQNVMTAYWADEANPSGTNQAAPSSLTNVNVYQTPAVTAVMSSSSTGTPTIANPTANTDFYVVYTLTGGYSGQSFEYGVALGGTPGSPAMSVYSPVTCTITSPATSCSIKIASGGAATNQSLTYTPQGGAVTPTPSSSGSFNVVVPSMFIFVTAGAWNGNLGGLSGADAKCNSDTAKNSLVVPAGTTWKALLDGNNATTTGVEYKNVSGTSIATATGGNLVGANPISAAINSSVIMAWTGENGSTNCSGWSTNSSSIYGDVGQPNYTNTQWWQGGSDQCSNSYPLYCVQQPPAPPALIVSVANNALKAGVDTANSCTTVTATLPSVATSAVAINFSVPAGYTSTYYFAPVYGGGGSSSGTSCTIASGGTTCNGDNLLCFGTSAAGNPVTLTGDAPISSYGESSIQVTAGCPSCGIFTTANFSGGANLPAVATALSLPTVTDGFEAGDEICSYYAATNGYTGVYKALIAGANRQPGGSDWVIYANTPYVRASDGTTPIGTSTAGAQLPATLTNAISSSTTPALNGFTYNSNPWVVDAVNGNCSNWTSATAGTWVTLGYPNQTAVYASGMMPPLAAYLVGAINNTPSTIGCNSQTSVLYCVQQ